MPLDLKISIAIGDTIEIKTVGDCLDNKSEEDRAWGVGEQLVYTAKDITNYWINVIVIDTVCDSVIFTGIFQESTMVTTQDVFNVQHNGATLCMDYDFKEQGSGRVRFAYKKQSEENWTYTIWLPRIGRSFYHFTVVGLSCETTYLYKAQLKYDSTVVNGETNSFMTGDCLT